MLITTSEYMALSKNLNRLVYVIIVLVEFIPSVEACGTTSTSSSGEIISEGYPTAYRNNVTCQWYMVAPSGMVIELTFLDVDLETPDSNGECLDTVSVYDGTEDSELLSEPFCKDGPGWPRFPTRMISSSNHMTVIMETNEVGTGKGIVANFKHVSPRTEMIAGVDTDNLEIFHFNRLGYASPGKVALTGSTSPSALSFDPIEEYFYFTDIGLQAFIGRVNLGGSKIDILVDDGLQEPTGIAVGYLTGLLYWTDSNRSEVSVSRLDGKFRKTLFSANTGCVFPKDILLGPDESKVYWTCRGQIEMSNADGSGREIFVNNGVLDPRSLTLDSETMTLFWTDAGTHTLESVRLDGSSRKKVYTASVFSQMSGFAMDSYAFFWANPSEKRLQLAERDSSSTSFRNLMRNPPSSIEGIYYYNSETEVQAPNACRVSNGGCQELCFLEGSVTKCEEVTPEIVGCPENIVKLTQGPQAVSWLEPSANSRSSTEPTSLSIDHRSHEPNEEFSLGTTTVTYSYKDEKGNTNDCFFNVTLLNETSTTPRTVNDGSSTASKTVNDPSTTLRGAQDSKYILIGAFAGLLFLILLPMGLFIWYRCFCGANEESNMEGQGVYSTEVEDYHTYYSISVTSANDPPLNNESRRNNEGCLQEYVTRVGDPPPSCDTLSTSSANGSNLQVECDKIGNDKTCLVGYVTQVDQNLSSDETGNDRRCLVGYVTQVDQNLSSDEIGNDRRCLVGYVTQVDQNLSSDETGNDRRCLVGYVTRVDQNLSSDNVEEWSNQ